MMNAKKIMAVISIMAPLLYASVLLIVGFFHPNYNHITQFMSELGALQAPNAIIMNVFGLGLLGLNLIVFAYALHKALNHGNGSKVGPILVAITGIFLILVAVFPCDVGCVNTSFSGEIHNISGTLPAITIVIALFALNARMKKDPTWKKYSTFTVGITAVTALAVLLYIWGAPDQIVGLVQRAVIGFPLFWMEIVAIKLFKMSSVN
jgi:hypothetical membrane protein